MSRIFCTKIKLIAKKNYAQGFLISIFLLVYTPMKLRNSHNRKIVNFETKWIIRLSFKFSFISLGFT